jgi:predicted transcriptional regulator
LGAAVAEIARLRGQTAEQIRQAMLRGAPEAIEARLREMVELRIAYLMVSGGSPALTDNWRQISAEVIPGFANN